MLQVKTMRRSDTAMPKQESHMSESSAIYVTGDGGEDLFTRSDVGGRPITHSMTPLTADTAYDFAVPRGAPFLEHVLNVLLSDRKVISSEKVSDGKPGLSPLAGMLTHIKQYEKKAYRVSHIDRLIVENPPLQRSLFWNELPYSPENLLIVHYGGGAWSDRESIHSENIHKPFKDFLFAVKTETEKEGTNSAVPPILVNTKQLPELLPPSSEVGRQFCSPLWRALSEHPSNVGVVVAMSTLRRFGAAISLGFSWEQTIEDFAAELHLFPELKALTAFRHLFVRVGVAGLIHIERDGNKDSPCRGKLYFIPDTLEAFDRDPEVQGRVIGKNSLLIASLANAHKLFEPQHRKEHPLGLAFCNAIHALRMFHDDGYSTEVLDNLDFSKRGADKYQVGEDLIKQSLQKIKEKFFQSSSTNADVSTTDKARCADIVIPQYLLDEPLPNKLRSTKRWRMLDDALRNTPVHRINVAMGIVAGGHKKILNAHLKPDADASRRRDSDLWKILTRTDYLNPFDRAPDHVTLEDGDHPSPPILEREDLPIIAGDPSEGVELIAPVLQFGKLLTVAEREEIEGLCSVSRLLNNYVREKQHYPKPISIAVFGPPGTGKSFAIKRIAETFDKSAKTQTLEYNVAQFKDVKDLGVVLTNVGSLNHQGVTPLVFFDEFDCVLDEQPLGWLKYFLAPMQDGSFYDAHHTIEIGRAIFVFAGGTYPSFERFDPRTIVLPTEELGLEFSREHKERVKAFAERKGPDFISRLRGHINISQINAEPGRVKHLIRRSLILRSLIIAQEYTHPKNDEEGTAMIDEEVIYALLTVDRYRHGVRSMEAILQMSKPIDGRIHIASLPSWAQLNMSTRKSS
jgi:hypothetical protein